MRRRQRALVPLLVPVLVSALLAVSVFTVQRAPSAQAAQTITFDTPRVVDPIHTNGEPDIGIDPQGRVFVSGPTGTGTQRSTWFGSVDGGHTFRVITPGLPPSAITGTEDPPGGGDTDLAFDHSGKQYFTDLYSLSCLRTATTADGGATVAQSIFPAGCAGVPGADRQWLAVYDPPPGTPNESAYTGPRPLIYMEYNDVAFGAQWVKSSTANDVQPGGPGLNFVNATNPGPDAQTQYAPFGADGHPAIDQVTGDVLQATYNGTSISLNIGTPDAAGSLTFLDAPNSTNPSGDESKLITVATGVPNNAGDSASFVAAALDTARNLYVTWVGDSSNPTQRQTWVSVASAASGWRTWSPPLQVSSAPSQVSVFPWVVAGGPGRADVVWYGSNVSADPSTDANQAWDVYMAQVVYPTSGSGAVNGGDPKVQMIKATPHPMHYNSICLAGTDCIQSQGNRNLADFFVVTADAQGAAEIVYDDTSNGLVQPGFTPNNTQLVDHAGAGVITIARQASGPGLKGTSISGVANTPVTGLSDPAGDALYPVIGGGNVAGLDLLGSSISSNGATVTVTMQVADLTQPATTALSVPGTNYLQYVTRWQMGNTIYYAAMENTAANTPIFYAGAAKSIDLCSVSACFPHVITYPEPGFGGTAVSGTVTCPANHSASNPCTITLTMVASVVGSPTASSLLEEVGAYALVSATQEGAETNATAESDQVPLEVDGVCCYNAK